MNLRKVLQWLLGHPLFFVLERPLHIESLSIGIETVSWCNMTRSMLLYNTFERSLRGFKNNFARVEISRPESGWLLGTLSTLKK